MADKDIGEKTLEELDDVFADICNVLLFRGKQVISQDDLAESNPHTNYSASGKLRDQERDTVKFWHDNQVRIAMIGFENQTGPDRDMPLRVISYDGAAYRAQFSPDNSNARYPVITMVLYFGYRQRWNKPRTLLECLEVPEEIRPFVHDYGMNLFEIAFLEDEDVRLFQSDFRYVADYFVQMRKSGKYSPPSDTIQHVSELLNLFSALTEDNRFAESYERIRQKERINMCTVLDEIEERGIEKGIEQGIEKGKNERDREIIGEMLRRGKNPEAISDFCGYPISLVREVEEKMLISQ